MKISNEVLKVLDEARVIDNKIYLRSGQLDRKTYLAVDKVLKAMGGKWNRKDGAHLFEAIPDLESVILTGEITDKAKEFGFFETPRAIVSRLVGLADLYPGITVLEPSAGRGAIMDGCSEVVGRGFVWGMDILQENYDILSKKYRNVYKGDFLEVTHGNPFLEHGYHRVVMNPPFAKQADIDHVNHAWKFVRPGGKLVAVMSAWVTFRSNKTTTDFRDGVERLGGELTPLPEGSFKESGTMVNTVVLVMDKDNE